MPPKFNPEANIWWAFAATVLTSIIINKLKALGYIAPAGTEQSLTDYLTSYLPYLSGAIVAGGHDLLYKGILPWLASRRLDDKPKA